MLLVFTFFDSVDPYFLGGAFGFCFLGMMSFSPSLVFWELHCSCIFFFYCLFLFFCVYVVFVFSIF